MVFLMLSFISKSSTQNEWNEFFIANKDLFWSLFNSFFDVLGRDALQFNFFDASGALSASGH